MGMTARSVSGLASAAVVTTIFVFGVQTPSQGQAGANKDVRVINTASEPVPTAIVGAPTVNIGNSPTVSIGNTPTVNIGNMPAMPARTPFKASSSSLMSPGQVSVSMNFVPQVPAGKRFVLESVSAHFAGGQNVLARVLANDLNEPVTAVHLAMAHQGTFSSSGDHYVTTQPVTIVLDAGGQLTVSIVRDSTLQPAFAEATVIGYFEDMP